MFSSSLSSLTSFVLSDGCRHAPAESSTTYLSSPTSCPSLSSHGHPPSDSSGGLELLPPWRGPYYCPEIQPPRPARSLGEPDIASAHGGGIHRLRYIDQQRAVARQFGVLPHHHQLREQQQQHTAWRPQRGLPESAVSVLRTWLFEHFLHPYPKESEKLMLARQASLTRGQVLSWFINARVRLWKPMIKEMYREEFSAEMESNSSSENDAGKGKDEPARSSEDLQSPSGASMMHGVSQAGPFKSEAMAGANTAVAGLYGLDDGAVNNAYSTAGCSLH